MYRKFGWLVGGGGGGDGGGGSIEMYINERWYQL
jgi:hypothetical protein